MYNFRDTGCIIEQRSLSRFLNEDIFMKTFLGGVFGLALFLPMVTSACFGFLDGGRGGYGMMGYSNTFWFFGAAIHILIIIIGILAAVWLWQHINKK